MKKHFLKFLILCAILFNVSCENDSEKDLIDITPVTLVTYNNNVKNIVDSNCTTCHNDPPINFAPMPLLTFDQVKEAVDNRELLSRVSSEDISFLMPSGGPRLPQATIDVILQWNTDGLLEQ
ncbi:hypothetical protein SAMN04487910_2521 [Aquimarina amphilecti]|uniref:Cytochrome c domain-containing protein n=1 Tax=Aquimarina amphilecti TaxID=1038014 RepID=A0A1H7QE78_AQUAM|nr:hypothetical protein [Aquimarina amphilecti]SEL46068.1 hypothetical protein SAMN04487910_2521 [Aquimarina amphilecti]